MSTGILSLVCAAAGAAQSAQPFQAGPGVPAPAGIGQRFTFAMIGDYGVDGPAEKLVADAVKAMNPDIVLTVGDNNYPFGERTTIDRNVGQYYHEFIFPYVGSYGPGATENRFFPTLGNHDLHGPQGPYLAKTKTPYLEWFQLPGNERYYELVRGQVHFFALNSDLSEPDLWPSPVQYEWLRQKLFNSTAALKVVYFHHSPYSSGPHGNQFWMQWPFAAWGADLVLSGHDHVYERLRVGGLPYVVNGLGGAPPYAFGAIQPGSELRFNFAPGFLRGEVVGDRMELAFLSNGIVVDSYSVAPYAPTSQADTLVAGGSTWRYLDDGTDAGAAWIQPGFDDSGWAAGAAVLGYGNGGESTLVDYGGDPQAKHVTTYFRQAFEVADPDLYARLDLGLLRDDGALVYLNGKEVHRANLPWGSVAYDTLAGLTVEDPFFQSLVVTHVHPDRLVAGTNVLAVEVHQVLPTSSDLAFALELTGRY